MKKVFIDCRMRDIEKEKLCELGYQLIEVPNNKNLYSEISSHVDIHVCKINNEIVLENSFYHFLQKDEYLKGSTSVYGTYPEDIKYNVCIIGNYAIHNFQYTDSKLLELIHQFYFQKINVKQGYTKCSIAVIDEKSIITSDLGIYKALKSLDLEILVLDDKLDIKLLSPNGFSTKNGFIGGVISRLEDNIFISGDLDRIDPNGKIRNFISKRNLKVVDFKGLEIIDYGGIVYGD